MSEKGLEGWSEGDIAIKVVKSSRSLDHKGIVVRLKGRLSVKDVVVVGGGARRCRIPCGGLSTDLELPATRLQ